MSRKKSDDSDQYLLRSVPTVCRPRFSVVFASGGFGDDVAWFFRKKDADEYLKWKQASLKPKP